MIIIVLMGSVPILYGQINNATIKESRSEGAVKTHHGLKKTLKKIKTKDYNIVEKALKKESKILKFNDISIYNGFHNNIFLSTFSKFKKNKFKNIYSGLYMFKSLKTVPGKINPLENISIKSTLNTNSDIWTISGVKMVENINSEQYNDKSKSNNFEIDYFKLGIIFYLSGDELYDILID